MRWPTILGCLAVSVLLSVPSIGQASPSEPTGAPAASQEAAPERSPVPDAAALLREVEANQKRLESLKQNYTYHVHTEQQELDKQGNVKKTETEDAESLTINGVRVNRVVARNGKPLTPEELQKENERLDKDVAKAKERRTKIEAKGGSTDEEGQAVMPLSRILELGQFSNPRREERDGRTVIAVDYAGNPNAKTHSMFEGIMRDMVGTLWIDQADRVMIAAQGHFLNDFKLGAGLMADVRKGTSFDFKATRLGDGVWLPADIQGQGSVRLLLFANFNGRMHVTTSDYRQFRTSATIVGSHGVIGPDGEPVPDASGSKTAPAPSADTPPSGSPH